MGFILQYNYYLIFITATTITTLINCLPAITQLTNARILSDNNNELVIELNGRSVRSDSQRIQVTDNPNVCASENNYTVTNFRTVSSDSMQFNVFVSTPSGVDKTLWFCVKNFGGEVIKWQHLGPDLFVRTKRLHAVEEKNKRNFSRRSTNHEVQIYGLRVEESDKEPRLSDSGVPMVRAETETIIRLFGLDITNDTWVTFTQRQGVKNGACQMTAGGEYKVEQASGDELGSTGRVRIVLPVNPDGAPFYLCVKNNMGDQAIDNSSATHATPYRHQGVEPYLQLQTYDKLLPISVSILIIVMCLAFSALFSGLNLGLMSLDRTDLKILCNTGNEEERKYARIIQPVRDHGNYLLCSILLGNVLVNSTFTILLDDLTSGVIAVVFSTLAIVIFGEISPQAVCSRHGLAVGARTIYITKAVMLITFPLSFPVSKILDWILGEEIGNVYNRERLKELVKVTTDTNDLDKDEVNIISGALELRKKTVADVMTRIEDIFMLDYEAVLDFETVSEIMKTGFSRIPVYEGNQNNIVTVLYIKDLAFVDPDDNTPLKTLCQFYQNTCNFVFEDQTLDVMFKQFKEGNKGHMAFVNRVNNEGECDPFYETIGLVTLEDVIEELIQAEIMDETDVFTDNRSKRRRQERLKNQDFSMFAERHENQRFRISPQLTLATYQYLSTSLDFFKVTAISGTTLKRLLKQDVFRHVKKNKKQEKEDASTYIYQQGKAVDYFVLILEGRVEVIVGKENLIFESGPFTYFGTQALVQTTGFVESPVVASQMGSLQSLNMDALQRFSFQPDYSVRAVTDVLYMRVTRSLYMAAKRATLMERSTNEHLDDEDDKLLCSLDGDDDHQGVQFADASLSTSRLNSPSPVVPDTEMSQLDPNGTVAFPSSGGEHDEETAEGEMTTLLNRKTQQPQIKKNDGSSSS